MARFEIIGLSGGNETITGVVTRGFSSGGQILFSAGRILGRF